MDPVGNSGGIHHGEWNEGDVQGVGKLAFGAALSVHGVVAASHRDAMDAAVWMEIEDLRKLKTGALRAKFRDVFGVESRSSNRQFLLRRIAWRLQACAEGDLTERARRRATEVADDADLRVRAPSSFAAQLSSPVPAGRPRFSNDGRLPPVGTVLGREYRKQLIQVYVRADGFEYQGRCYRSLSAIAREVTGTRWNGLLFFGLTERRRG